MGKMTPLSFEPRTCSIQF